MVVEWIEQEDRLYLQICNQNLSSFLKLLLMPHLQMLLCMHCLVDAMGIEMEQTAIGTLTDLEKITSKQSQNTSKIRDILHAEMHIQN